MPLSNIILLLIFGLVLLGCLYKLLREIMFIFAFPTYLGLHYLESLHSGLKLNLNKSTGKKRIMDFCAMICTLFSFMIARSIYNDVYILHDSKWISKPILPYPAPLVMVISLLIIYIMSYLPEKETVKIDDGLDKIEKIKTPDALKTIFQSLLK